MMRTNALPAILLLCCMWLPPSHAQGRTTEVNNRLEDQSNRVGTGLNQKKKNKNKLMRADDASYRISAEEQAMRTRHAGKLTRHDQRVLNRQLNRNSNRIRNAKHD